MNLTTYLTETKAELKHVSWPTRRQTVVFTATVIIMSLAVAFLLGFFDALFSALLKLVI